jgi:hypothetical protein
MPKAGRKRGRGRGRWCRKECSGCACSVAAPGFVLGLFTRSKRGCRAQGDIGRMVSMGERERERENQEKKGARDTVARVRRPESSPRKVVRGRGTICLSLFACTCRAGSRRAAGTSETRRALVNHSGGHVGIDPTATFMCRVLGMSLHSPSLSIPSRLSRFIYVMSAV